MAKSLELLFVTNLGKQTRIFIDNPKEPVDSAAVKLAMEEILATNIFQSTNGTLAEMKSARLVERKVTDYEIS